MTCKCQILAMQCKLFKFAPALKCSLHCTYTVFFEEKILPASENLADFVVRIQFISKKQCKSNTTYSRVSSVLLSL